MVPTVIIIMKCSSHEKMLTLYDREEKLSGAGQEYNAEVHAGKTELQVYKLICSKHHWTYVLLAYH